jgi:hypothetical protein
VGIAARDKAAASGLSVEGLSKRTAHMAFWSDPMKTLQRDIDAAKANLGRLRTKLAECEAAIIERRAQAMQLARDGAEDGALDKAEAATRAALDRKATISGAIADVELKLAALEKTFAENPDRIQREQTAKEIEQTTRRVIDASEAFTKAAEVLGGYLAKVTYVPESASLLHLTQVCTAEVGPVTATVTRLAREYAASVTRGDASPVLKQPMQPYTAPPPPPKPETVPLFALRPIKWKNADGMQRVAQKFQDVDLPPATAARAIRIKACVQLTDPLRRQHHGTVGGNADPALALDLDEPEPRLADPIMQSSPFETPTIGEPRILKIATRSLT